MTITMLLPLLAFDLLLSVMADSVKAIHALLANEFLPGHFTVGIVNFLQNIDRRLAATFSGNLPVTDSDLMVARLVFGAADVVTSTYLSSQCTYSFKLSGPFLIQGSSAVALVVSIRNVGARITRTEFDGPDPTIECLQVVLAPMEQITDRCKRNMVILQTPCLKPRNILIGAGRLWFAAERTGKGNLLAGVLLLVLLLHGFPVLIEARPANPIAATNLITYFGVYIRKRH